MGPNGVPRVSGMWPKAWDRLRQGLRRPLEGPNRAPGSIEKRVPPPENASHQKRVENLGFERFSIIKLTLRLPNGLKIP